MLMDVIQNHELNSRKKLLNFVDLEIMKGILDAFTKTTNLMANIVDVEGRSIFSRESHNKCCSFCKHIYSLDGGLERCRGAYKRYGKQAAIFGEPYIFRCPAGLVEWAAPIIVQGEHLGSVICGQVLMWEPEDFFWVELRELNKELISDFTELFAVVKELPVVSPAVVRSASYLMHIIANYIMDAGWSKYVYVKEISYQQALLHEEIINRNQLEKELADKTTGYSFAYERELMLKIKFGETDAALELMQKLLADIVGSSDNGLDAVRTSVISLCVLMSRSAVDAGISMKQVMADNSRFFNEMYRQKTIEEICLGAQKFLEHYMERIATLYKRPINSKVYEIKKFILEHHSENLTLDTIAKSVYLSPSYASRLFKKVQDCSIMEYLTSSRIEEAKRLLHNPVYLIDEIASNVGYSDASYFTKVFRRAEGLTPTQYRNMQHQ
ncbi:MAG: PocR ligand-binding domain-containing protein [Coriobacteriales bacterium]|jgi:AraC-like DNA-binding protein/ligand-binding sensor protein|nr:PocR ligand-binding domain-containing protein [Coriobacteriales bacterium]